MYSKPIQKTYAAVVQDLRNSYAPPTSIQPTSKNTHSSSKTKKSPFLVFIYNLPWKATIKEIWSFFKPKNTFEDIILPKKDDKFGKRYGFLIPDNSKDADK